MMMAWTIVNLIDGEADWFLRLLAYLAIATLLTFSLRKGADRFVARFESEGRSTPVAFLKALYSPFGFYLWFLVLVESLDLISDRFLSSEFHGTLKAVLGAGAVGSMAWFLMRFKKEMLDTIIKKKRREDGYVDVGRLYAISKLISVAIFFMTALLLMDVTGQNITTIIAFGGISGLAIAFAAQEIIANFFWGIMLHINQPFGVGDNIIVPSSGIEGTVEDIGWYQTLVRSLDKRPIYIPNILVSKVFIINSSRMTHRRVNITLSLRQEDLGRSSAIIAGIEQFLAVTAGFVTSPKPLVYIGNVGPYSVDISVQALSSRTDEREFLKLRDVFIIHTAELIQANGARLALPIQEVVEVKPSSEVR